MAGRVYWTLSDQHQLEFRVSHTSEQSNLTYQGLSRADFEATPYDRYDFTSRDRFSGERSALAVRHRWDLSGTGSLLSTAYAQLTDRVWDRGEHAFDAINETYVGTTATTAGVERDASARARRYHHGGVETRWHNDLELGGRALGLDAGMRLHLEGQNNAVRDHVVDTGDYLTRSVIVRDTIAGAVWAQAAYAVGGGFTVIPGVRVESLRVRSQREVNNYAATTDPQGSSTTSEVLPGLGFTWDVIEQVQLYGGVHRGFSPPSYSQAVSNTGVDNELDSELSWNTELGARWSVTGHAFIDAAIFYIDYENIIAQGIAGGPQINGGKASSFGAELLAEVDVLGGDPDALRAPLRLTASYVKAEYESDVFSGATLVASAGNAVEFVPALTLAVSGGLEGFGPRRGFGVTLTATYVDEQYSDGLNTEAVSADGSTGVIDDRLLFDLTGRYKPQGSAYEVFVTVENLLDETYVAYRRGGQGTVSGAPLKAVFGVAANF